LPGKSLHKKLYRERRFFQYNAERRFLADEPKRAKVDHVLTLFDMIQRPILFTGAMRREY
jgi:hypothetical protein